MQKIFVNGPLKSFASCKPVSGVISSQPQVAFRAEQIKHSLSHLRDYRVLRESVVSVY